MKKTPMTKTISLLLCLVLVLGMVPARALATEESTTQPADDTTVQSSEPSTLTVYVNGKDVKEIDEQDDTITWNEETKTLTLNNASILAENGTYKGSGIYAIGTDTLVLELVGENTVEGKFNGRDEYYNPVDDIFANAAISVTEGLTIRGDGSLTATDLAVGSDDKSNPRKSAGIFAGGDLTIESGVIHAVGNSSAYQYSDSSGIICGDYDTLSTLSISGGTVNATGASNGITAYDTIRVSGGSVNADGKGGDGLYAYNYIINGLTTKVFISGGTVTLCGARRAAFSLLSCGGYENAMWTTAEDGPMNYNRVPGNAGMMSGYLRIEPADLRLVQPTSQNQYTVDVENRSGEEVTATYQWYQVHTQPVTSEDVDVAEVCTYDETTGLWLIPSAYEADISILTWAAVPGNIVTLEFQNPKEGLLIAMTNTAMFDDLSGGVFSYVVTEEDIDPETGLFMMGIGAEHDVQVKISLSTTEEVQTAADAANRFSSGTAGTYFSRVTLSRDGAAFAELESKHFDYLPVNTVTFDPNGGTCETASAETQNGLHTLAVLPEATLTGYTFDGWFDAKEGGNRITTDTLITEDITLYARWIVNVYTLTIEGPCGVIYQEQIPYGADLEAILSGLYMGTIFVEGGYYTFTGVFEPTPEATMPAEAVTLKAVYTYSGWKEEEGGITYLFNDEKAYFNTLAMIGSGTYFFDENSYIRKDISWCIDRYYALDHETGHFLEDYTGIYEALNGDKYYVENGVAVKNKGLVKDVLSDGHIHYYYFGCGNDACTNGCDPYTAQCGVTHWVENNNGYLVKGSYTFDEYGVIIHDDDTSKNGVHEDNGVKFYYMDGVKVPYGLFIGEDGEYYYATTDGSLAVDCDFWIPASNTNGLTHNGAPITEGTYSFDAEGRIIWPTIGKNGVYYERGAWYYYKNNTIAYNTGLIQVKNMVWHSDSGDQIMSGVVYVRSNGQLATGTYYVTNVSNFDGSVASGAKLQFNSMGLMTNKKNGFVNEGGTLYYYVNDQKQYNAGLILIDGNYYYVRSNGIVVTDRSYWITKTNGLKPQGCYEFDASGKMIISELDGIVEENGIFYYYVDGIKQIGTGAVQLEDGAYIYVRSNGQLATGIYWVTNHNGLLAEKSYNFGTDGKLYL